MANKRGGRVPFSVHGLAAIGGAAAAALFALGWGLFSMMGTTADIYMQLVTSIEIHSVEALIEGAAVSFAIGSLIGAAIAWLCNRLGLSFEPE